MKGIDISVHNKTIDFAKVKRDGVQVVIIKATEGINCIDKKLEEHYQGALKEHLNIGFYHFMSEKTDPRAQARDFYNAIKNKKYNVYPVLDIETNNMKRTKEEISNRCLEFLDEFYKLTKLKCVIYTGGYFGKDFLNDKIKKNYNGWIAHYGVTKPMNNGFTNIVGHQYTEHGKVAGITTNVDLNIFEEAITIGAPTNTINNIISDLQRELNSSYNAKLVVDGIFGAQTLNACKTLKKSNTKNNLVTILQRKLVMLKFLTKNDIDGYYGTNTYNAVVKFQKSKNILADGIVGKQTWRALFI